VPESSEAPFPERERFMNEKYRAKMQDGAQELLEPGETVQLGLVGLAWPELPMILALGILPFLYAAATQKNPLVLLTDRHIYVMRPRRWSGTRSDSILAKHQLNSVDVRVEGRKLLIGDRKIHFVWGAPTKERARAIAAGASQSPPAAK
jgi:hypothetical protein